MSKTNKMRKDTFAKLMAYHGRYLALTDLEKMSNEQRLEYKKEHNPYLVYEGAAVKLNDVVDDEGNIVEDKLLWTYEFY